jgi:hypothetical protein
MLTSQDKVGYDPVWLKSLMYNSCYVVCCAGVTPLLSCGRHTGVKLPDGGSQICWSPAQRGKLAMPMMLCNNLQNPESVLEGRSASSINELAIPSN